MYQSSLPDFDEWGFPARSWDEAMHAENPCVACAHSEAWHIRALEEIQSGPATRAAAAEAMFLAKHRDRTNE